MFQPVNIPEMPRMPKIEDFQGVTENVEWITENYRIALQAWQEACARWERVSLKLADAMHIAALNQS